MPAKPQNVRPSVNDPAASRAGWSRFRVREPAQAPDTGGKWMWLSRRLKDRESRAWLVSLALHVAAMLLLWQIVRSIDRQHDGDGLFGQLLEIGPDAALFDNAALVAPNSDALPDELQQQFSKADQASLAVRHSSEPSAPTLSTAALAASDAPEPDEKPAARDVPRPARGGARKAGAAKERGANLDGVLSGRTPEMRAALVKSGGGTKASEDAVELGLHWLARQQHGDGSWNFPLADDVAPRLDSPPGATGLALLSFLGAGYTHNQGKYRSQVTGGLKFLVDNMEVSSSEGWLRGTGQATMYVQAIGAIALCEALAMTKDAALRKPAQLAINFIVKAQDPQGGGWRYRIPQAGDTSVVGWQMMALQSARIAELDVPDYVIDRAARFLRSVESQGGALYGYTRADNVRPSTTAVGLLCRIYLGRDAQHIGLNRGIKNLAAWGPSASDMYYSYYATQVLHHWEGPLWERWNPVMRDFLVNSQSHDGDAAGSWNTDRSHGSEKGGRLYTTCLSIMTLEVYYRYLSLYRRRNLSEEL